MDNQKPAAPRFNVRVMPKSKEELSDPVGMVDLVLAKLNMFDPATGKPPVTAIERKAFIQDIFSVPPEERVARLRVWVHVVPSWEMGKITQAAAQGSGTAVRPKRKRKRIRKPGAAAAEAQDRGAVQAETAKGEDDEEGDGE